MDTSLPLQGNFFIEASAGSGKTFSMEQIFVRLLIDTKPLCLSQILIVTFTKDATREISGRIRKAIRTTIASLENPEYLSEFEYIQAIQKGNVEQRDMAILKLSHALHIFEEANIYTIHGFCLAMLAKFAFEANSAIGCSEDSDVEYSRELLKKWLISIPPTEVSSSQLESVVQFFKGDTNKLLERLFYFVKNRGQFGATQSFALQIDAINSLIQNFSFFQLDTIREQLILYFSRYPKSCNNKKELHAHYLLQIDAWISVLSKSRVSLEEVNGLLSHSPLLFHLLREPQKKNNPISTISEKLIAWTREIHQCIEKMLDPTLILFHMARIAHNFIQEKLMHTERMPVDDILDRMLYAIQNQDFISNIQRQFATVMIDEFQDTDAKQWKIFSKIFFSKNEQMRAIYLVGDPKQSIYSFRNANLDLYFLAEKHMGIDAKYRLDTNYRSSPRLVRALNRLFDDGRWLFLHDHSKPLPYLPAKVGSSTEEIIDNRCIGDIHFFLLQLDAIKSNKAIQNKETSHIFPFIYREVTALIEQDACQAKDIVILVKDRYLAKRLMDYFDIMAVAYCTKGINSIATTLSFSLLYKLFSAISNLQNTHLVIDFFMHPLLQISLHQLRDLENNSNYLAALHGLFLLSKGMRSTGVSGLFAKLMTLTFFGYSMVDRICARGEEVYSDFIQIIELIMLAFPEQSTHPEQIVYYLQTLQNKNPEEDPRIRKRGSNNSQALTIMTIHASKGLEFPVVFGLGLGYRTPLPEKIIQKENVWTDLSKDVQEYEKYLWKCEEEKMRQLYVAATRAKKRLYLPIFIHREEKPTLIGTASPIELFVTRMIYPSVTGRDIYKSMTQLTMASIVPWIQTLIKEKQITYEMVTADSPISSKMKFEFHKKVPKAFSFSFSMPTILSFSKLMSHQTGKNIEQKREKGIGIHAMPTGSATGTLLHEIFDIIIQRGIFSPFREKCITSVIHEKIARTPLYFYYNDICQMVQHAFHMPLLPYSFSLVNVEPIYGLSEMHFVYTLSNKIFMKGIIDLLFKLEEQYFILDWKSHYLGENEDAYTKENMHKTMVVNNYFLQAAIYAKALKKYLSYIDPRPFSECFGGVIYIFLRGISSNTHGIYHIPLSQMKNLDELSYDTHGIFS